MMQLSPSRSRVLLLVVPAAILGAVVIATAFRPGPVASVPSASPSSPSAPASGTTGLASSAPSSPAATPAPTRFPPFVPPPAPCVVPASLPEVAPPAAAPVVQADGVALLFASHLYERRADGEVILRDRPNGSWEMGIWFVPAGSSEPRLLAAPERGMVLPLGLSPDGAVAAIWWLSSRRTLDEASCDGGIYLVSTDTGESRLVVRHDWTGEAPDPGETDSVGVTWTDPHRRLGEPRTYALPEASVSSDGQFLALIDPESIEIYLEGEQRPRYRHVGACTDWAWSPEGAVFAAGCESMTSAWIVDAGEGYTPESIALPWFASEGSKAGWGGQSGDALGFTREGHLRLAAFYGFATGCEDPGQPCTIPPPAYALITVDRGSREATIRSAQFNVLVGETVAFAADASWIYVQQAGGGDRTLNAMTGELATARRLREVVGGSADGTLLFGSRFQRETGLVTVSSLGAAGDTRQVATISWAEGAIADSNSNRSVAVALYAGAPHE